MTNLIFDMDWDTMPPFDKPYKFTLDWDKWRLKQKPRMRTQIWYADSLKRTTCFGAGMYGKILNHEGAIGQYTDVRQTEIGVLEEQPKGHLANKLARN